jgi:hypothetical protein
MSAFGGTLKRTFIGAVGSPLSHWRTLHLWFQITEAAAN